MKKMTAEEFRVYCLLYASESDFNITRQELIAVVPSLSLSCLSAFIIAMRWTRNQKGSRSFLNIKNYLSIVC